MDAGYVAAIGIPFEGPGIALRLPEEEPGWFAAPAGAKAPAGRGQPPRPAGAPARAAPPAEKAPAAAPKVFGFLQEIVDEDLKPGGRCAHRRGLKNEPLIRTRFPPEPNGYLHIGHAKSIIVNFGLAELYGGQCNLRFDDTNPATEETEYVRSIQEDVRWLGYEWGGKPKYASEYFDQLYEWAVKLIKDGKAYVDSQTPKEMKENRGSVTKKGVESRFRNRTVAENMELFEDMRAGKYKEGEHVLRMKGDMGHQNMNMRDMPIYRILHKHHHNTGNKWCIYPLYDFAHGQEDAIEGITHSICTLEFEAHRELYDWFIDNIGFENPPKQFEMARLNVTTFLTSKRKLRQLVERQIVDGWDDPRMSTLSGMRRRGVPPEALRSFIKKLGVTNKIATTQVEVLDDCIRETLDPAALRRMVVLRPLRVVIDDYPEGKVEEVEALNHPSSPALGSRRLKFSREIFIEHDDFRENASADFFRLKGVGSEVKLRYCYVIKVEKVVKNDKGEVIELRCSHDPKTRDDMPTDRKVKGVIHWVSAPHACSHTVRLYDFLLKPDVGDEEAPADLDPGDGMEEEAVVDDFQKFLAEKVNQKSKEELHEVKMEASLSKCELMDRFQFERNGFFVVDKSSEPKKGKLVFNRIVCLKESGLKSKENATKASNDRRDQQAKQAEEREAKKNIDPRQMFRAETDKYSKFDDDGVPTHGADGEALPKSRVKTLKKDWDKQKKVFESAK